MTTYKMTQPLRTMREVKRTGLAQGMFDPDNEVTLDGSSVREKICALVRTIPDYAFETKWKEGAPEDLTPTTYLKMDRTCAGPVLYVPSKRYFYTFLRGRSYTMDAENPESSRDHWFVINNYWSKPMFSPILYVGDTEESVRAYLEFQMDFHAKTKLLYAKMTFPEGSASYYDSEGPSPYRLTYLSEVASQLMKKLCVA